MADQEKPCCPKCGSTQGFSERLGVSGFEDYGGEWGDEPEFLGNDNVRYRTPKFVKCIACRARIRREIAVGEASAAPLTEKPNE